MVLKIEQARNICEENQRQMCFHLFSMAGNVILLSQLLEINNSNTNDGETNNEMPLVNEESMIDSDFIEINNNSFNLNEVSCERLQYQLHSLQCYLYAMNSFEKNRQVSE
jgi:hypothetical protein